MRALFAASCSRSLLGSCGNHLISLSRRTVPSVSSSWRMLVCPTIGMPRMMSIEALWPEADYHKVADETLDELIDLVGKLESELDDVDITLSMGVLNINLGEKFQNKAWVINKQTPNRQVWWSSPLSGPRRYEYDGKENGQQSTRWKFTRDASQSLQANLRDELRKVTGLDL